MYGKVCYTQSIIIDLTHLISFELRRVIDENACKELLNLIPAKKIAQRAQRESNTDFKVKVCVFCHIIIIIIITSTSDLQPSTATANQLPGQ